MFNRAPDPPETDPQNVEPPETLGSYLKGARLRQGLELTTVAEETRINIKNLAALEEDTRAALPTDVFSKGFVRIYAAHLKLDTQKAIDLYTRQWGDSDSFSPGALPITKQTPPVCPGIAFILALIALFFGIRFFSPTQPDAPPPSSPTAAPHLETTTPSQSATKSEQAPDSSRKEGASPTSSSAVPAESDKQLPPYAISLSCTEETPVAITLDDGQAETATCTPGGRLTWTASKGFDLTLDRTNGVELTINDGRRTDHEIRGATHHHPSPLT